LATIKSTGQRQLEVPFLTLESVGSKPLESGGLDGYGSASEEGYDTHQDGEEFVVGGGEGGDV
jgi:hypothetical protein